MKLDRGWRTFILIQGAGVASLLGSSVAGNSAAGPALWFTGFFLLMPGDLWPVAWMQHMLWGDSLSVRAISAIALAFGVLCNGIVWFALLRMWRSVRGKVAA